MVPRGGLPDIGPIKDLGRPTLFHRPIEFQCVFAPLSHIHAGISAFHLHPLELSCRAAVSWQPAYARYWGRLTRLAGSAQIANFSVIRGNPVGSSIDKKLKHSGRH